MPAPLELLKIEREHERVHAGEKGWLRTTGVKLGLKRDRWSFLPPVVNLVFVCVCETGVREDRYLP